MKILNISFDSKQRAAGARMAMVVELSGTADECSKAVSDIKEGCTVIVESLCGETQVNDDIATTSKPELDIKDLSEKTDTSISKKKRVKKDSK